METTLENPAATTTATAEPTTTAAPVTTDPFTVDEAVMATLSPESRTAAEGLLNDWKSKATKHLEETSKKYEPIQKKAEGLDRLAADPKFQAWYREQMNPTPVRTAPQPKEDPNAGKLTELWTELAANAQDPVKYGQTLQKIQQVTLEPQMNVLNQKSKEIELSMEFDQLSRKYPDLWDLDKAGLFEPFLYYYKDLNGRPMEEAYIQAKKVSEFFNKKSEAKALGMVEAKKASVTEGASTTSAETQAIVYARDPQDALRKQIEENMQGGLKRKVVIKK